MKERKVDCSLTADRFWVECGNAILSALARARQGRAAAPHAGIATMRELLAFPDDPQLSR
jgi:hypothetical protein